MVDIIINELSLNGQYLDENEFLDFLPEFLKKLKLIGELSFIVLKNYQFYDLKITSQLTFRDLVINSRDDRIRKFKSLLLQLSDTPPFWEEDRRHSFDNSYECKYTTMRNNYGIAEACERDKMVLSFYNETFHCDTIEVIKNGTIKIAIYNVSDNFLDHLYENNCIIDLQYCLYYFKDSKLDFSCFESEYGFNTLELIEKKAFISSFKLFADLDWEMIYKHDSLRYKKYNPNVENDNWFKNSIYSGKVDKFRVTEKLRCFGYKDGEKFYVLRFERDHKKSDKG